jgi:hopanoid biosynthesis associated RND transporter like protein HpnN
MNGRIQHMQSRVVGVMMRHPVGIVLAAVLGAVLALLYTATHLEFDSNRLDLISAGEHYQQLDAAFSREFEDLPGKMVVVIQSQHPERAKAFATALAQRWQTDPHLEKVFYRINVDALKRKGLLYLSPDELTDLRQKLQAHQALLKELAASPTLQNLLALVNREVTTSLVSHLFTGFLEDTPQEKPPDLNLLLTLLQQMDTWLQGSRSYQSPWAAALMENAAAFSQDGFLWSDDKHLLFVFVTPKAPVSDVSGFSTAVQRIRADVREIHQAYPEIAVGITGSAMLDSDEMVAAERDTTIASMIAVVGVTLLYCGLFKGVARPLLALGTLLIAVCWSLGLTTLTIGHLNIFSIAFMPMLLGLGIDYGGYLIARFEEEQAATGGVQQALVRTFASTGPGIATAALTTAFTFGTLLLPGFKGVAELGFIGGSGILLTLLSTFTVLPALLVWHERHGRVRPTSQKGRRAESPGDYLAVFYRYPRASLAASALFVGLSLWYIGRVGADFNLLHLQARGTESVLWEQKIFESTKQSPLFAELAADSLAEVTRKVAALKALPSVAKVESLMSVIPADQAQKLPRIEALRPLLADISLQRGKAEAVDLDALRSTLGRIGFKMQDNDGGQAAQEDVTHRQMHEVRRLITQFDQTTARMGDAEARQALAAFQAELMQDLAEKLALLQASVQAEPVTPADLPPELRARYIGAHGKYRIIVYPAQNVWEFQPLARFVTDVRAVDPDVLGTPVMNFEFIRGIEEAYAQAGLYAFVGIVFLVLLTFRAVRPALLALVPLAVGSLWTLGLMGLLPVTFNVANLIVLPLIMAPAVEGGLMIVYRYREEASKAGRPSPLPPSTGRAVVFSSLSTIVGFGSLMISRHWGIFSIGLLLTVGVASVLLASVTVLPSLLAILSARGSETTDETAMDDEPSTAAKPGTHAHQRQPRPTLADRGA